jgi:hypothetical protein
MQSVKRAVRRLAAAAGGTIAITVAPTGVLAAEMIVPSAYANVEAPSNMVIAVHDDTRFQVQYQASDFAGLTTFSGVAFRFDSIVTDFYTKDEEFNFSSDFKVQLATAANDMAHRSLTFNDNLGADALTVLRGPKVFDFPIDGHGGELKGFGIEFDFTRPFTYDPSKGDLVLDIYFPNDFGYLTVDFLRSGPDMRYLTAFGVGVPTGSLSGAGGPVTKFFTIANPTSPPLLPPPPTGAAAAPEPATWALVLTGFGLAGASVRAQRRVARRA